MRVVIMGCGRVGARLAGIMDGQGHHVTILDTNPESFSRLPVSFEGTPVVGDGTDEEVLREAEIERADAFVAVTQGDNRNVMASQVAKHVFHVPKVVCRIYDPIRQEIFKDLGLGTHSPTTIVTREIYDSLEA